MKLSNSYLRHSGVSGYRKSKTLKKYSFFRFYDLLNHNLSAKVINCTITITEQKVY